MTLIERIDMAINRINAEGWMKGFLREGHLERSPTPAGPGCLLGSLMTDTEILRAYAGGLCPQTFHTVVTGLGFTTHYELTSWNDRCECTKEEVLHLLVTQRDLLKLQAEANKPQEVPVGEAISA